MSNTIHLKFNLEGMFKIVQFTDIHRTYGEEKDAASMQLMEEVLDLEKPDLVFYSGDLVSGNSISKNGLGDTLSIIREVVEPADRRGIPWATVFGNHDGQGNANNQQLLESLQESPLCLTEGGPEEINGIGNYVLKIGGSREGNTAALIYAFDSGDQSPLGGWGSIARNQIDWYIRESQKLTHANGSPLPALAFFHIPIPEYDEVWDHHVCHGTKWEKVCCPNLNTGLFAALYEMGDVMGTFVGHDHGNDYYGDLHGIRLTYGRATGGYSKNNSAKGARIIQMREGKRGFNSWIRLSGGVLITEQPQHQPEGRVLSPLLISG